MRKFSELRDRMPEEAKAESQAKSRKMLEEMPLHQIRAARELTQKQLAETLHINQSEISKVERRTDMYVSTLRNFITAMGGSLEIYATFPEGQIRISQFEESGQSEE